MTAGRKKSAVQPEVEFVIPNDGSAGQEQPVTSASNESKEPKNVESSKGGVKWIVLRPEGSARSNACGERVQSAGEVGGDNGGVIVKTGKRAKEIADALGWKFQIYQGKGKIIKTSPKSMLTEINWDKMDTGDLQLKIIELQESGALDEDDISIESSREEMIAALKKQSVKIQVQRIP